DDISNGLSDYEIELTVPHNAEVVTDLDIVATNHDGNITKLKFAGQNRNEFSLFIEPTRTFYSYKNEVVEVVNGLQSSKMSEIQQALIIDRITKYIGTNVGNFPHNKITVSQA